MLLTLLAIASVVALGVLAYRVLWSTRDAGAFRVRKVPLAPPQSGGG